MRPKPTCHAREDTFTSVFISFSPIKTSWYDCFWQAQQSRLRSNLWRKVVIWKFPTLKLGFERQRASFPGGVPVGTIVLSQQQRDRFSGPRRKQAISVLRRNRNGCCREGLRCLLCGSSTFWGIQARALHTGWICAASPTIDALKQRAQAPP